MDGNEPNALDSGPNQQSPSSQPIVIPPDPSAVQQSAPLTYTSSQQSPVFNQVPQAEAPGPSQNPKSVKPLLSLIFGIISVLGSYFPIFFPFSIAAIILGFLGRKTTKRKMAIAGMVLGILSLLIMVIVTITLDSRTKSTTVDTPNGPVTSGFSSGESVQTNCYSFRYPKDSVANIGTVQEACSGLGFTKYNGATDGTTSFGMPINPIAGKEVTSLDQFVSALKASSNVSEKDTGSVVNAAKPIMLDGVKAYAGTRTGTDGHNYFAIVSYSEKGYPATPKGTYYALNVWGYTKGDPQAYVDSIVSSWRWK